jgi:hypothetical protein
MLMLHLLPEKRYMNLLPEQQMAVRDGKDAELKLVFLE